MSLIRNKNRIEELVAGAKREISQNPTGKMILNALSMFGIDPEVVIKNYISENPEQVEHCFVEGLKVLTDLFDYDITLVKRLQKPALVVVGADNAPNE